LCNSCNRIRWFSLRVTTWGFTLEHSTIALTLDKESVMKRFFTLVAVAVLTTAFATSAFAVGWGPNGMYGKADPNAQPVGPSSTPSTHPASAPIINPPDPTKDLGFVPGSYNDPAVRARLTQAQLEARKAKAKAAVEGRRYDPKDGAKFAPAKLGTSMSSGNFARGIANFGVPQMPVKPKASKLNGVPPRPLMR
jgi:hypothetical protein